MIMCTITVNKQKLFAFTWQTSKSCKKCCMDISENIKVISLYNMFLHHVEYHYNFGPLSF